MGGRSPPHPRLLPPLARPGPGAAPVPGAPAWPRAPLSPASQTGRAPSAAPSPGGSWPRLPSRATGPRAEPEPPPAGRAGPGLQRALGNGVRGAEAPKGLTACSCALRVYGTLQKEVQEGNLHPAHTQEPLKGQESILRPIHPPLIINISLEEEEEEEEEENYASYLLTKTPADIEEEKAIKEMCYKSGEYYRIQTPQENESAKIMSSTLDNELLKPMETGRDLQEGDGVTVPTKFNIIERQGEVTASLDGNNRTDLGAFENGGGDCYVPQRSIFVGGKQSEILTGEKELTTSRRSDVKAMSHTEPVKKRHFKGVKKKKWISEEPKNSFSMFAGKAMHASNPKGKANCQQNDQSKDAENTCYVPSQRATGRSISLNSPEPGRSTNTTYSNVSVTKESKLNPPTDKWTAASYNSPAWRKRSPHTKAYS
uniref:Chromosome 12 open reading frame 50 n=1 Tax=Chrysemys picta bellii TaxID=8478 RepID=A0A8C3F5A2_CHRPI